MAFQASNIAEIFLWTSLGILGITWILHIMSIMIKDENPLVSIRGDMKLSDIEYPAITICSEHTTKFAFAEQLGNYVDPDQELPHGLQKLRHKFFDELLVTNHYGELT